MHPITMYSSPRRPFPRRYLPCKMPPRTHSHPCMSSASFRAYGDHHVPHHAPLYLIAVRDASFPQLAPGYPVRTQLVDLPSCKRLQWLQQSHGCCLLSLPNSCLLAHPAGLVLYVQFLT